MVSLVKQRNANRGAGAKKERCALGVSYPFEYLDIVCDTWCTAMVSYRQESVFLLRQDAPTGVQYVAAAWEAFDNNIDQMLQPTVGDMDL